MEQYEEVFQNFPEKSVVRDRLRSIYKGTDLQSTPLREKNFSQGNTGTHCRTAIQLFNITACNYL